jgi:hypothetical protein
LLVVKILAINEEIEVWSLRYLCPKNVKLIGTICVGYPDEKPEKLGFFSNNVLAVRIQTIHYYAKIRLYRTIYLQKILRHVLR